MANTKARITVRIDFTERVRLGPGKIALLEAIRREGSISAAARALDMSYRRAWLLVDGLNHMFESPAVVTYPGRAQGGGAKVTQFGERVAALYRAIERQTERGADAAVRELAAALSLRQRGRAACAKLKIAR